LNHSQTIPRAYEGMGRGGYPVSVMGQGFEKQGRGMR